MESTKFCQNAKSKRLYTKTKKKDYFNKVNPRHVTKKKKFRKSALLYVSGKENFTKIKI